MGEKYLSMLHGTINIDYKTSSTKVIMKAVMTLYEKIMNKDLLTRRINITANNVVDVKVAEQENATEQLDLFTDYKQKEEEKKAEQKERNLQKTMLNIKKKYGKNAILKGMNFLEDGTTIDRNTQVGGHRG